MLSEERQATVEAQLRETNPRRLQQTIYKGLRELLRLVVVASLALRRSYLVRLWLGFGAEYTCHARLRSAEKKIRVI